MRLSELITIYLAAAAPVGVAYFLQQGERSPRSRTFAKAVAVALCWPFALFFQFFSGQTPVAEQIGEEATSPDDEQLHAALAACLDALHEAEDTAHETFGVQSEQLRHALLDACSGLERYVGLTRAATLVTENAPPSARETELPRVAGRTGDDLQIAGRCLHRRNVARLRAHQTRARVELLHALAEIHEVIDRSYLAANADGQSVRHFSQSVVLFYGRVIDLLSQLEQDQIAAYGVARLLDAACARVRTLEVIALRRESLITHIGNESCTASTPQ
ncbi:MAG: hypothetical protein LC742_10755, partial [Acidobacteria bacterium]|nr:hypothetical protein [Acidobacteriota bacterium]